MLALAQGSSASAAAPQRGASEVKGMEQHQHLGSLGITHGHSPEAQLCVMPSVDRNSFGDNHVDFTHALEWHHQAILSETGAAGDRPDHRLLTDHPPKGILSASLETAGTDQPFIRLTLPKPYGEGSTARDIDPEMMFVLLMHTIVGGSVRIEGRGPVRPSLLLSALPSGEEPAGIPSAPDRRDRGGVADAREPRLP